MKKHFFRMCIILIITLTMFPNIVKANYGDLRYQITKLNINDNKMIFTGWAFIHKTNNFTTVYENGVKSASNVKKNGGGQKIRIVAINVATGKKIDEVIVDGGTTEEYQDAPNYNFYFEQFTSGDYRKKNIAAYNDTNYNSCSTEDSNYSQCYYQDMAFKIAFDISKWQIDSNSEISFYISAYNNHYGKYTTEEQIYINESIIKGNGGEQRIEVKNTSDKVKFIAYVAQLTINNEKQYYKYGCNSEYCGDKNSIYFGTPKLLSDGTYFSDSNYRGSGYFSNSNVVGPGEYKIWVKENPQTCNIGLCYYPSESRMDGIVAIVPASWVKPYGDNAFTVNVKNDKKCKIDDPNIPNFNCNKDYNYESICDELTVGSSNVKITQTGNISTVLNPNEKIYQGGGFNFGILYSNIITMKCNNKNCSAEELKKIMESRIKDLNNFTNNLKLEDVKLGNKIYTGMYKNCSETSIYSNNFGKIVTTCLFHLSNSKLNQYTGKVDYILEEGNGISNKYYIPINYSGPFPITIGKIFGLSRLDETQAEEDTEGNNQIWFGNWNSSLDCSLNVKNLFYNDPSDKSSNSYNFIYRPIDLINPFPNRNAGINWFEWIRNDSNKQRLKDSYTELQYRIELDNQKVSQIRKYNSNNNYLDWSSITNGKSSFIDTYFSNARVGGNS